MSGIAQSISSPAHEVRVDAGFGLVGRLLHDRRMTLIDLADRAGMTLANLSILKTGKARAIHFSTLEATRDALGCQPGELLGFEAEGEEREPTRKRRAG